MINRCCVLLLFWNSAYILYGTEHNKPVSNSFMFSQLTDGQMIEGDKLYWPTQSALTTRLRRLITAYQRTSKNRQVQQIQPVFPVQACVIQTPYEEASLNPKMAAKIERQQRSAQNITISVCMLI